MNPVNLLKTLYLGDRYCTKIIIDSVNQKVEFYINCISRVRDESGDWKFYSDEDIIDGAVVFWGIKELYFDPSGLIPNDQIYNIEVTKILDNEYEFIIETSNVDKKAMTKDLIIRLVAEGIYLLDPNNPNVKII